MGRMEVAGLRLNVASDDFFLPGLIGISNRVVFLALNILFLLIAAGTVLDTCGSATTTSQEDLLLVLMLAALAISAGGLVLYSVMLYVSTRGTPADEDKRAAMPTVVVLTTIMYIAEAGLAGTLTYLAATWPAIEGACEETLLTKLIILIVAVIGMWCDVLAFCFASYIFLHRYSAKRADAMHLDDFDRRTLEWEGCFRVWCRIFRVLSCNLFGFVGSGEESDEVYLSVAEVFNTWFNNTDLTLTDLLAAAVLVRLQQKEGRRAASRYSRHDGKESKLYKGKRAEKKQFNVLSTSVRAIKVDPEDGTEEGDLEVGGAPLGNAEAYKLLKEHYDYLPFVLGMYGWKLMLYSHTITLRPFTGLRKVLRMPNANVDVGHGDNCCNCSKAALLRETGLDPDQVIYGNFGSVAQDGRKSIQVPHAVFADHERRAVVVAMRGTLSLQDLMTDAMIEPASLVEAGRTWGFDGTGHYAHAGMLKMALRIRRILEKNKVLHLMLGVEPLKFQYLDNIETDGHEAINVDPHKIPDCNGYDLVITGHSLGAAAAMLLTLALRPTFPNARCMGYAIPGAVVSRELADSSSSWCTNIWLGDDVVPHLNWQSLSNLRLKVFDVLYRCKVSKARILRSAVLGLSSADLLYEPFEVPQTEARLKIKARMEAFKNKRKSRVMEQIPMYAPGVLVHMAKLETLLHRRCLVFSRRQRVYEPHIVRDRTVMEDPVISTRSLFDHFPNLLPIYMREIIERHKHLEEDQAGEA